MRTLAIRLLVLSTGFLLALPPGWCMTVPRPRSSQAAPQAPHGCCSCKKPVLTERPAPKPGPTQPYKTFCCRTDLHVGSNPRVDAQDLMVAAVLTASDLVGTPQAAPSGNDLASFYSPTSLHVLNCIWRC